MPRRLSLLCRSALALALLLPSATAAEQAINAKTFFPASDFPQAQQRRLAANVLGREWLRDAEVEDYVQRIARQLLPQDEHFIVLARNDAVNAFAYLGGLVVVYDGLWQFAEEEDGFVGVIAHELAHVRLDHVHKTRENAERVSAMTLPLLLGGLLVESPEAREALLAGGAGVISSDIVTYSRELEHEADIYAFDLMQAARRDVHAMARLFSRFSASGNAYLSTHPAPARRGAYMAQRVQDAPPAPPAADMEYDLLRKKLARDGTALVERTYQQAQRAVLASAAATQREKLLAHYGLLLSANKTRNKALGAEAAAALAAQDNPLIVRARAESLSQRGEHQAALHLLQQARTAHPQRLALLLQQFAVHTRLQQYEEILILHRILPPALLRQPQVWLAAGRAAAHIGQNALSNYLLATGQALAGEFEQARRQIAVAERMNDGDTETLLKLGELKTKVNRELQRLQDGTLLQQ